MAIFFIVVLGYTLLCVAPAIQCVQIPSDAIRTVIAGGTVELAFEIPLIIRVYREKFQPKDNDEEK